MIETIMEWINSMLGNILWFLPDSPFTSFIDDLGDIEWLGWLNWFVPVGDFIKILAVWITAVGGYYLYSIILRWIRAVE